MKIAFNPSTVAALTAPPDNKDITFDLRGQNIFARGVKFCGTDTNTWRDIKINNVSIDSNTLDLRDGDNTTLTNINGVVTINSTWRPVVDNLTSDSTTSSLSANQGRILKALIDGKSDSGHTHDDRYVKKSGDTMLGALNFANGTWNLVGDDSYMGDCNISGHFGIKAANTTYPGIAFFNNASTFLGNLTAYSGNIKYGAYSLQFLDNGNTSVSAGTWMNPFSDYNSNAVADGQAICVWGQSSSLSNLAADSGDMSLWLKRVNANVATLNMVLDGEYYANGNQRLAHVSEIPNSLKNPYSLTTFGVVYDGSAAKTVTTSTFISQVTEGTSTITDGTMFITSYASNSGFADTNAVNVPYKRKAIHLWEYIKAKTDSLYAAKNHNHDDRYLKLTGGTLTGDLYINTNLYGPAVGNNPRNRYDSGLYFFNCNSFTTSTYNFGLYQWDNEFQFTYRTSADNLWKGNSFTIQGSDGQVIFTKTPKVGSTSISLDGHTHAYLPLSGGTMTGNIILKGGTSTDMTYAGNVHPYIRFDTSDSSQNVSLIFTDYDAYRSPAGIKLVGNQGNEWFEAANIYATNIQTNNIKNLSVGGGIYWNPYVESTTDGSDAASITVVKSGVAGGTTLVLSQRNDANDTIQFQTNGSARLYHNSYPILTTQNTYVSNNKGYINNTEITQVNNASNATNSINSNRLNSNTEFALGNNFLQYFNTDGLESSGVNNAAPDKDWWHIIRMNHPNSKGYFSELAIALNSYNGVYWRTINYGREAKSWTRLANIEDLAWNNIAGKPSSYTPSAHTHSWTSITDKIVAGNEFNIVNAGFNGDIWFNYVPINDRSKTATVLSYIFGNGHQGSALVQASGFVKTGSNSNYVLLGDGGHQTISSLSVNYANSAGRANYLSGHGVNPDNSHPGHGARVFYSWNTGCVGNSSSGYSNGITIGSHPNDTAYGFQIVQNMWNDRTYTRRYNGGWQSWKTLAWTSDIPTSLPANGGNADTVDGEHASSFVRAGNYESADLNNLDTYSFIRSVNSNNKDTSPKGNTGWYNVIQLVHRNGGGDGSGYIGQIALGMTTNTNDMFFRGKRTDPWKTVIHSGNYTEFINNYYWANVKISTSANTQTQPSVNTIYANNWFRSQGYSGWYNESFGGGIWMNDSNWIKTYGGKSFYCDNQIYSSNSIKMSDILLEHTNEINSTSGIHLNYRNSGDVSLCVGGGRVGIGTRYPSHELYVIGYTKTDGFGIKPYYLSDSGLLPTISPGDGYTYRCLEIGKSTKISCIIADRVYLSGSIRGVLLNFKEGVDGQIVLLKDLQNYGAGNGNGYFWVMPSRCVIIRADGSGTLISYNQISNIYDDGKSRFFVYSYKYRAWIEFLCA